jgi:hypothetical protein
MIPTRLYSKEKVRMRKERETRGGGGRIGQDPHSNTRKWGISMFKSKTRKHVLVIYL